MTRKRSQKEIRAIKAKGHSNNAKTSRQSTKPRSNISSTPVSEQGSGPYKHNGYTLHTREVTFKSGHTQRIYFFCTTGKKPKSGVPCSKPEGMTTGVNKRTGLPYLKKNKQICMKYKSKDRDKFQFRRERRVKRKMKKGNPVPMWE